MPVPYNVVNLMNNTSGLLDVASEIDQASNGLLGIGIVISVWVTFYLLSIMAKADTTEAFAITSIITAIISVYLAIAGVMSGELVAVTVAIYVVSLAILWWSKGTKSTY